MTQGSEAGRVGLVVPPANPTVEPEIHQLLPQDVSVYSARLPRLPELSLEDRLAHYAQDLQPALASMEGLRLDASLFACTGTSYTLSVADEEQLVGGAAAVCDAPVHTSASALGALLAALSVQSVRLVTPYPEWLTQRCVDYWARRGVRAISVTQVRGADTIYGLATEHTLAAVDEALALDPVSAGDAQRVALAVVGTGAPSLGALELRAEEAGIPLVSTNLAGAWQLMRSIDMDPADSPSRALRRVVDHVVEKAVPGSLHGATEVLQ